MRQQVKIRQAFATVILTSATLALFLSDNLLAAPLPPDDASIRGDLQLWLRDAKTDFDTATGQWSDRSGQGHTALPVGDPGSGITYLPPILSATGNAVTFAGQADDLLWASDVNGGSGLNNLTIFSVYRASIVGQNLERPVGFGSVSGDAGINSGDHFNLAADPSIRKDNGQIGAGTYSQPHPGANVFFVRAARMDGVANSVNEWFGTAGNSLELVMSNSGNTFTTSDDNFYLGDVRAGMTPVLGSTSTADIAVAEAIVYNAALTDSQVVGVGDWLMENVDVLLLPEFPQLTIDRITGGMTLSNSTGLDVAILGYSATSAFGALDQDDWTSVAGHYDASATGDGSVDPDDPWTVLSAVGRLTDLSEAELVGGDGGQLQSGAVIDLGTPWLQSPTEDVEVQLLLTDGTVLDSRNFPSMVRYIGNGDQPLALGDLDFDGTLDAADWTIFKDGFDEDLTGMSLAQAYQMGDLDADLDNDPYDFGAFKDVYDAANGTGAFAAMIASVPEPSTTVLLALAGLLLAMGRRALSTRLFSWLPAVACVVTLLGITVVMAQAAPLAPDDPSLAGDLLVWLRDVRTNFDSDTGTWADLSGNGHDAAVAGEVPAGVTFGAPILSEITPTGGAFGAKPSVAGVTFQGAADDLLKAAGINEGTPLSDVTLITVYQSPLNGNGIQRPAGIGSIANTIDLATRDVVLNQADDASLRYDWGATPGTLTKPDQILFTRATTLSGTTVNDYFDAAVNIDNATANPGGSGLPPTEDALYLGDLRAGTTPLFNSTTTEDIFIAEVIVYDRALDQQQIEGIGEWLEANVAEFAFPRPTLEIDPTTGQMALTNETGGPLSLDLYRVASASGSLDPSGWTSLEDQNLPGFPAGDGSGNGWEELGTADPFSFAEGFLTGSSVLSDGDTVRLGRGFQSAGAEDVQLQVRLPSGAVLDSPVEYVTSPFVLGDVNLDGIVNGLDVDPFVGVLLNGPFQVEADMNQDDVVNGLDVDPFVAAVVGGGLQAVPEPSSLLLLSLAAAIGLAWRKR